MYQTKLKTVKEALNGSLLCFLFTFLLYQKGIFSYTKIDYTAD